MNGSVVRLRVSYSIIFRTSSGREYVLCMSEDNYIVDFHVSDVWTFGWSFEDWIEELKSEDVEDIFAVEEREVEVKVIIYSFETESGETFCLSTDENGVIEDLWSYDVDTYVFGADNFDWWYSELMKTDVVDIEIEETSEKRVVEIRRW